MEINTQTIEAGQMLYGDPTEDGCNIYMVTKVKRNEKITDEEWELCERLHFTRPNNRAFRWSLAELINVETGWRFGYRWSPAETFGRRFAPVGAKEDAIENLYDYDGYKQTQQRMEDDRRHLEEVMEAFSQRASRALCS